MTVLDDLRSFEERVVARMKELEPLIAEYKELESLAQRLGIDSERVTAANRSPATGARGTRKAAASGRSGSRKRVPKSRARRRRPAAPQGQRREQVLAMVKERPGVTVPDIAKSLGVDPTGLYRVVRGLQKEGQIKKEGTALTPV